MTLDERKLKGSLEEFAKTLPEETRENWEPLEKVVPRKWQPGFMFMGKYGRILSNFVSCQWYFSRNHYITKKTLCVRVREDRKNKTPFFPLPKLLFVLFTSV